jgi:4-hydroxy-tetrahydrodipicolinate synthase
VNPDDLKALLEGCYVTVPTPFEDSAKMPVNEAALRTYVRFLIDAGLNAENATSLPAVLLAIFRP